MKITRWRFVHMKPVKMALVLIFIFDVISHDAPGNTAKSIGLLTATSFFEVSDNAGIAFWFTPVTPVAGVVINSKTGEPLSGVTVTKKGSRTAVITDNEGRFSIDAGRGDVLVISSVGYTPYELVVSGDFTGTIKLSARDESLVNVTVIGSRGRPRTDVSRPVPVDIIDSKELENTGQVDLGQMAQFTSPSFNSAKNGINGVANFADPASLRGMSPDQSLVLVNGKRRHQFSAINNNVTVGKGTVVTDLNSIPLTGSGAHGNFTGWRSSSIWLRCHSRYHEPFLKNKCK